jgi:hypothetical protein
VAGAIKTGEPRGRQDATLSFPRWIPPQLCQLVDKAPSGPQWLHEIKLDGFRMAERIDEGRRAAPDSDGPGLERKISKHRRGACECEDEDEDEDEDRLH